MLVFGVSYVTHRILHGQYLLDEYDATVNTLDCGQAPRGGTELHIKGSGNVLGQWSDRPLSERTRLNRWEIQCRFDSVDAVSVRVEEIILVLGVSYQPNQVSSCARGTCRKPLCSDFLYCVFPISSVYWWFVVLVYQSGALFVTHGCVSGDNFTYHTQCQFLGSCIPGSYQVSPLKLLTWLLKSEERARALDDHMGPGEARQLNNQPVADVVCEAQASPGRKLLHQCLTTAVPWRFYSCLPRFRETFIKGMKTF
ncbi:hypothetical protein RRG08_065140 [Elysia crispata]|uniref:Uncharacterized protein n=1 Tax=Elysia crispata TaxID=231223 RepID=A0AAE0Z9R5_9GAST|nr:hypothetical protein RRG08_065140 [Elysia crispata]